MSSKEKAGQRSRRLGEDKEQGEGGKGEQGEICL